MDESAFSRMEYQNYIHSVLRDSKEEVKKRKFHQSDAFSSVLLDVLYALTIVCGAKY